jgi:predicted porin
MCGSGGPARTFRPPFRGFFEAIPYWHARCNFASAELRQKTLEEGTHDSHTHWPHGCRIDRGNHRVNGVARGLACTAAPGSESTSSSDSNGLLPAALALGASTHQGDYDLAVTFGLFPGISTNDGGSPNLQNNPAGLSSNTALGTAGLDVRQVFLTFGNDRMGTVLAGRNIGLFGQDAILGDMTLLGVGAGGGDHAAPSNTSLGSIGLGYIYTDWLAQIDYTTPDISGFKFTVGIFDPVEPLGAASTPKSAPGIHGKVAWTHDNLYFSATFLQQKQQGVTNTGDYDSHAFDVGGKVKVAGAEFMAYYYNGTGVGTTGLFVNASDGLGHERDSDGFLAQVTYTIGQTKLGVNYGESNLDTASGEAPNPTLVKKNSKFTLGVYQNLTDNLMLLAEFTDINAKAQNGVENKAQTFNVGAFLKF